MRIMLLVAVLAGCARVPVVEPYSAAPEPSLVLDGEPVALGGPRAITVLGPDVPVVLELATELEQRGFLVSRVIQDVTSPVVTLYVVHLGGACDHATPSLHAEIFEVRTNQSLFRARAQNPTGCPGAFVHELAALLDVQWARPKPVPRPATAI